MSANLFHSLLLANMRWRFGPLVAYRLTFCDCRYSTCDSVTVRYSSRLRRHSPPLQLRQLPSPATYLDLRVSAALRQPSVS